MHKSIKKISLSIGRALALLLELTFFLLVLFAFLIQTPFFQKQVARQIANVLSYQLNTTVIIDNAKANGWHYIKLEGLYVEDLEQDTLLYAQEIIASVEGYDWEKQILTIDNIAIKHTHAHLEKHKGDSTSNFQFLVDYFVPQQKNDSSLLKVFVNSISFSNSHLSYNDWNKPHIEYGIDYNHLEISNLYGDISHLQNSTDSTTFDLGHLRFNEKSGFSPKDLTANVFISPQKTTIDNVLFVTEKSNISAHHIHFKYLGFDDFNDFVNAVYMNLDIHKSQLNLTDLSYFAPVFKTMSNTLTIKGYVQGPVNDMLIEDLYFGLSNNTYLSCNADIKGLPYMEDALFFIEINEAQTLKKDLELIDFTTLGMKGPLHIPEELSHLGIVNLSGTVEGAYNDFSTNMNVASNIGFVDVDADCFITPEGKFGYKGTLNTSELELNDLNKDLGILSSELELDGTGTSLSDLILKVKGSIPAFEYKNYVYKNIEIDGNIAGASYDGMLTIEDKNVDFNFNGEINLNTSPMSYNFKADLQKANLYDLNLLTDRPTMSVCLNVEANGFGNSIDDFSGFVHFNDIAYYENGKDYYFDSVLFESQSNINYHSINVFSKFADFSMEGRYKLRELPQSLYGLGSKILPSIFTQKEMVAINAQQFDLDLKVRDLSSLTSIVYPELYIADNTQVSCEYQSSNDLLKIYFYSDSIIYQDWKLTTVQLDTTQRISGLDPFYVFNLSVDSMAYNNGFALQNIQLNSKAYQDNVGAYVSWGGADFSYNGKINVEGFILSPTQYEMKVLPSSFYGEKIGEWLIKRPATISIDSTAINIDNLLASNHFQTVRINGKVSERPVDQLNFELGSFKLTNLNELISTDSTATKIGGELNLAGFVSDVYNDPFFDAYAWVNRFSVNNEVIGDVEANANWNYELERMEILGSITRENGYRDFEIAQGFYYPRKDENNLDFLLQFKQTDLQFVNLFLPEVITGLKGKLQGDLFIKGKLSAPELQGDLYLDSAQATVSMLNTTYTTKGNIKIEKDFIGLEALPIYDKYGTQATLVGTFMHQNFQQYSYDFFAFFDKPLLVMNTTYEQNPLYYGTAFATGDVSIGYENILEITVHAKSEKNTRITLPLYGSEDVVLEDFITFVNNDNKDDEYEVDLNGINLNLSFDITEDAEIKLVFDDLVGDVMEGRGNGHIDMYIDQFYDFYMFGNYTIKEGSYLFTLRDFINKKFEIKEGGTISWYGNPYDADINITAVYPLRTSLYDIMPESERDLYRQKTFVETEMHLSNSLFNPDISFDINLPRSDENAKSILSNVISTPTEMNRQVFSLLILNKFLPRTDVASGDASRGVLGSTTSEVLSNQLSNMLANFTDNFDVGFNYRPGDQISNNEIALALSTQLFNDKLTISTNLGVSSGVAGSSDNQATRNFIGDVDIEYQLNDNGNLRVHAFNKSNEFDISNVGNFTNKQGIGLFYQESFNSFKEFWCKLKTAFKDRAIRERCNEME